MGEKQASSHTEKWRRLLVAGNDLLALERLSAQAAFIEAHLTQEAGPGSRAVLRLTDHFRLLPQEDPCQAEGLVFIGAGECPNQIHVEQTSLGARVTTPLAGAQDTCGMLCVDLPGQASPEMLAYFETAARYFGRLLELSRLERIKGWRMEQLALLRQANREIVQLRGTDDLFPRVAHLIQSTFNLHFVAIYSADESAKRLRFEAGAARLPELEALASKALAQGLPYGQGLAGACAAAKVELDSFDLSAELRHRPAPWLDGARSCLCLPLLAGDRLQGVLELSSSLPDGLHENDRLVLRVLSDNVAVAARNAGLIENLLGQAWLSTLLLQVSEAAQQYDSADDLAAAVARTIPLFTDVERCAVFLKEPSGEFILNAHFGFEKNSEAALAMLPYSMEGLELFTRLLAEKEPVPFPPGLLKCSQNSRAPGGAQCGLVPVAAHGQVLGAILVDHLQPAGALEEGEISAAEALQAVGRQTALAIENLRLEEARGNEAYVTAVLLQVAEMVVTAADLQETLDAIIHFLPLVVGVDTAFVYLLDEGAERLHLGASLSYNWKSQLGRLPGSVRYFPKTHFGRMLESGQPAFYRISGLTPDEWLRVDSKHAVKESDRASITEPLLMVLPLFTHEGRYGLLYVLESEKGFEYREKKAEIVSGIARNLSMAIQNEKLKREMIARERIHQQFAVAQDIQRTFLPEALPELPGWHLAARWRPAQQVGGDFYDAFRLEDGRLGLVIADVSDKGLPAALYMTVARTLIHAAALEGESPSAALARANRALLLNSQQGLFVTCLYALLDPATGEMAYANAGHNKPLWLRKSRADVLWLEKGGMPLGVAEPLALADEHIQLKDNDHLVFYTDGVTEARAPDGALFGEERLFNILNLYRNRPSSSLIDLIDQRILDFRGGAPVSDDLTLLVLHRRQELQ